MSQPNSSTTTGSTGNAQRPPRRNLFQKTERGSVEVYEVLETNTACVYRIDIPGCPESDLIHWVDGSNLHFFADEPANPEYRHRGRKYGGTLVLNPATYDLKGAEAKLVDGVLWVTVPKIPGSNATIDVIERFSHVNITRPEAA